MLLVWRYLDVFCIFKKDNVYDMLAKRKKTLDIHSFSLLILELTYLIVEDSSMAFLIIFTKDNNVTGLFYKRFCYIFFVFNYCKTISQQNIFFSFSTQYIKILIKHFYKHK